MIVGTKNRSKKLVMQCLLKELSGKLNQDPVFRPMNYLPRSITADELVGATDAILSCLTGKKGMA
ncbi:MAG: hypothetical protein QW046_04750 [Candidatus Micrarchaeaceae archaeon]